MGGDGAHFRKGAAYEGWGHKSKQAKKERTVKGVIKQHKDKKKWEDKQRAHKAECEQAQMFRSARPSRASAAQYTQSHGRTAEDTRNALKIIERIPLHGEDRPIFPLLLSSRLAGTLRDEKGGKNEYYAEHAVLSAARVIRVDTSSPGLVIINTTNSGLGVQTLVIESGTATRLLTKMAQAFDRKLRGSPLCVWWHGHKPTDVPGDYASRDRRSLEVGVSAFNGGSSTQHAAHDANLSFELATQQAGDVRAFKSEHLDALATHAWSRLKHHFPLHAAVMLATMSPKQQPFPGTGFHKATAQVNCATPLHFDSNFLLTVICTIAMPGQEQLVGGQHILLGDHDYTNSPPELAVVVEDSPFGTIYIGDYQNLMHGNLATLTGRRFIVTFYNSVRSARRAQLCGSREFRNLRGNPEMHALQQLGLKTAPVKSIARRC